MPIHELPKVEETKNGLLQEGHNAKLDKSNEDGFNLHTVLTAERDGSLKLASNSKLIDIMICRDRYQI